MEPKTTTLHPTCFKITAMHLVCCYNLLGWRSFWNVPPSLMDWPGWQFLFTFRPEKDKLSIVEFRSAISEEKSKYVSANQRTGRLSCFSADQPKNTSLVKDVETLLPVKFYWILFSSFRGKVENVSVNHRPGRPFLFFFFSIHLKNTN